MATHLPAEPLLAKPVSPDELFAPPRALPSSSQASNYGTSGHIRDRTLVKGLTQEPFHLPFCSMRKDGPPSGQLRHYYHASLLFDELEIATCASVGSGAGRGFFGRQHMARFFVEHCSQGLARFAVAPLLGSEMDMWLTGAACVAVLVHRLAFLTQMAASSFVAIPPALQLTERTLSDLWAQAFTTQLRSSRPEELGGLLASAAPCHPPALYSPQSEARWELLAAELFLQAPQTGQAPLPPHGFLSGLDGTTPSTNEASRNQQRELGGGRPQAPPQLPTVPPPSAPLSSSTSRDTVVENAVRGPSAPSPERAAVAASAEARALSAEFNYPSQYPQRQPVGRMLFAGIQSVC
jgi:hypothetical protein